MLSCITPNCLESGAHPWVQWPQSSLNFPVLHRLPFPKRDTDKRKRDSLSQKSPGKSPSWLSLVAVVSPDLRNEHVHRRDCSVCGEDGPSLLQDCVNGIQYTSQPKNIVRAYHFSHVTFLSSLFSCTWIPVGSKWEESLRVQWDGKAAELSREPALQPWEFSFVHTW